MPRISVVVPSFRPRKELLEQLFSSLAAQSLRDFEVVVVDDGSPDPDYVFPDARFRLVRGDRQRGPAACRNAGAAEAAADALFFTDTDCRLEEETLASALGGLERAPVSVGNTLTDVRTPFGGLVALLGFPGGGSLGFDRVWRVNAEGFAQSFSSCNVAIRKAFFQKMGGFDASFPVAGGEDTVLARRILDSGGAIWYEKAQRVFHVEKPDLASFLRWQLTRGRGNFHIRRRVPSVRGYLRLRVWTFRNSLASAGLVRAPAVLALIVLSVVMQTIGYWQERRRWAE
ncbi:MAG TPA: glycosyltransferase [Candidatus Hydrogenedentes bacterium]|nr:glycosyltransferase [Candidatus Hydrogenedentota bacterium]